MKSLLPALALFFVTLPVLAQPTTVEKGSKKTEANSKCVKCSHAPCKCGYSPSYYTSYRKPVNRAERKPAPVKPHWSRPQPTVHQSQPTPPRVAESSPRVARVVPAVTPRVRQGYVPQQQNWAHRRTNSKRCAVPSRASALNPSSNSLVPTPRRARVVPAPTPRTSLGFDPSRSWAHGGVIRRRAR